MREIIINYMEDSIREIDPTIRFEQMHKIMLEIVKTNFPICAKKYLAGEPWQIDREQE